MSRKAGFTMVEVMLALAVGGLVVLMAHQVFAGAADGSRALAQARDELDRDANARRWLQATFLSLAVADSGSIGFTGDPDGVRFTAWQLTPGGWFEPRNINLGLVNGRLTASVSPGETLVLADSVTEAAFDYLLEPGANTHWVRQWISPVSAPVAVRIRIESSRNKRGTVNDTLLLLIKERG